MATNKLTIKVLRQNNIKDFAAARNEMSENSNTKWILFLDSDEALSEDINYIDDKYNAYKLLRKNYFLGNYVGSERLIRLVKKGGGKWLRAVHETFVVKGSRIGYVDAFIIHNTAKDLSSYISKINKYSTIHAQENRKEKKVSSLIKIIVLPLAKFFVILFKSKNVVFSIMQSLHSFLSWTKLYFLQH